ncbi:MAG TPA: replicative DNA helicase [Verrucomicrobiae bacterium]
MSKSNIRPPERLPPHSIEAEQGLLGSLFLDPRSALPEVRAIVQNPDLFFYDLRHAVIFQTFCELSDENKPIDLISIQEALKVKDQLEAVGGIPYLSALPDVTPSAANIGYYADLLEEKAVLRKLLATCTDLVRRILDGDAGPEIIEQAEREILAARRQNKGVVLTAKVAVDQALSEIEKLHTQRGAIGGISTGLIDLDRLTDGLHSDELIILAAFPGVGKSALAMNIVEHVAVDLQIPVGVFSLEMSGKRLMRRLLASRGRVNLRNIRDGNLSDRDFKGIGQAAIALANAPVYFCDLADLTISQLRSKARQMVQQFGIQLIVVDYLQLLTAPGKKDQNRENEVANISRGMKMMAQEFGIPVVALSQLNDNGQLRESRAIGQDADTIWRLQRKDNGQQSGPVSGMILEILKQRDGEAPCSVDLTFLKTFTRFECAAREMPSDI